MARDAPKAVEDDEGLAMAIGLDVGMRLATRGTRDGDSDANVDEDDDDDDGVLRAMDRLGTRDEALLSRVGALGTRGEGEGEGEDEAKAGGRRARTTRRRTRRTRRVRGRCRYSR